MAVKAYEVPLGDTAVNPIISLKACVNKKSVLPEKALTEIMLIENMLIENVLIENVLTKHVSTSPLSQHFQTQPL